MVSGVEPWHLLQIMFPFDSAQGDHVYDWVGIGNKGGFGTRPYFIVITEQTFPVASEADFSL